MTAFAWITVLLLVAGPVAAADAPAAPELTRLLEAFLDGASRNDVAAHQRFWADDLIYTGSGGRRVGKADILRDVRSTAPPKPGEPTTRYAAADVRIHQYGSTAVVAFRLLGITEQGGRRDTASYLNTGTFLERGGTWQAVSWQATKLPAPDVANAATEDSAAASGSADRAARPADHGGAAGRYRWLVVLHLLGATLWVGGHLVLSLTVLPRAMRARDPAIVRDFEAGYERIGIPALLLQVVTGWWLAHRWAPDVTGWLAPSSPQEWLIAVKLLLLAATVVLGAHARLRIIPRLTAGTMPALALHVAAVTVIGVALLVLGAAIRTGAAL